MLKVKVEGADIYEVYIVVFFILESDSSQRIRTYVHTVGTELLCNFYYCRSYPFLVLVGVTVGNFVVILRT